MGITPVSVRWVDAGRFLALDGNKRQNHLRLHTLGGDSPLIASNAGEFLIYDFYFEEDEASED